MAESCMRVERLQAVIGFKLRPRRLIHYLLARRRLVQTRLETLSTYQNLHVHI